MHDNHTTIRIYDAKMIRQIESDWQATHDQPLTLLMTRAGMAVLDRLKQTWPNAQHIVVVCGAGNNGGDGFVVGYLAMMQGFKVTLLATDNAGEQGDAALMRQWFATLGGQVEGINPDHPALSQADVIVDALLGTGIDRPVTGLIAALIQAINASEVPIISVDVPSGVCATTGRCDPMAINADCTVTFIANKIGLMTGEAMEKVGQLMHADLGVDTLDHQPVAQGLTPQWFNDNWPICSKGASKIDKGHAVLIGGDQGMPGAGLMMAKAALIAGAGRVTLLTHPDHATQLAGLVPEIMCQGVDRPEILQQQAAKATVIGIGPGMVADAAWSQMVYDTIGSLPGPKVVDAGGLTELPAEALKNAVITPHEGEAARLLNQSGGDIRDNRPSSLQQLMRVTQARGVVLKGPGTLIGQPQQPIWVAPYATSVLATGGSGDILTGLITGIACQQTVADLALAAGLGVMLQGQAAELYQRQQGGPWGAKATDILAYVPKVLNQGLSSMANA